MPQSIRTFPASSTFEMSHDRNSPTPPLTAVPKDHPFIKDAQSMRKMWEDYINELTPTLTQVVEGSLPSNWVPPNFPKNVKVIWDNVYRRLFPGYTGTDPADLITRFLTAGPVRRFLMSLRLMQLDMRGDSDMCYESMRVDDGRLAKLIRDSMHDLQGFERVLADEKFLSTKPLCLCFRNRIFIGDALRVVPCSKAHKYHEKCLEEHFRTNKVCPECHEWVL